MRPMKRKATSLSQSRFRLKKSVADAFTANPRLQSLWLNDRSRLPGNTTENINRSKGPGVRRKNTEEKFPKTCRIRNALQSLHDCIQKDKICSDRDANRNDELALLAPPDAGVAAPTTAAPRRDAGATQLHLTRPRLALPSKIAAVLTMEVVEVEGTEIAPEDATLEAGWISSHRNKQRKHASNAPASPTGQGSASDTPMLNGSAQRLPRKPRQPRLPDDQVKVVIRLSDGLNLSKVGEAQLRDAILREVDLHATLLKEDIYRTCVEANLIVVSTPHLSNAEIYSRISKLHVETETYDVRAYVTSPENTAKGVIHNISPYDSPEDISASLVNDRNPKILQARRMGKTNMVLIVFDGDQVPFHVYYRGTEYRCYLHKKRAEVCDKCGTVGHRSDVCPKPNVVICTLCGTV
ncbi:hypothetical protein HPB51_000046 [Rhipicephalus microplus]|uniref:CCHC-type domain-containing protein n=1 Tax=Rhipicephalus microplus TaxID=6941 RepID=A0A9J6E5M9_RHIMP|nr:hypothetical protein HPB51_000046 [Rhipicephalus microplus]